MTEEQVTELVKSDITEHFDRVMNVVLDLRDRMSKHSETYDKAKQIIAQLA
jgi:hypothetical protein